MSKRTITLTNRRPVSIDDDNWPIIASAQDDAHDGQVECQANCKSHWFIAVRQHDDGRAIVYAVYTYSSNYTGARDYANKQGVLLSAEDGKNSAKIVDAINTVGVDIACRDCGGDDNERWDTLIDKCIADLPAEELA